MEVGRGFPRDSSGPRRASVADPAPRPLDVSGWLRAGGRLRGARCQHGDRPMTTIAPQAAAPRVEMPPTEHRPQPYAGPSREDVLAMRRQYMNPAIFTLYREPLMIVEGHMQYLWD